MITLEPLIKQTNGVFVCYGRLLGGNLRFDYHTSTERLMVRLTSHCCEALPTPNFACNRSYCSICSVEFVWTPLFEGLAENLPWQLHHVGFEFTVDWVESLLRKVEGQPYLAIVTANEICSDVWSHIRSEL